MIGGMTTMDRSTTLSEQAVQSTSAGELFSSVYELLRSLARAQLAGERPDHTLQPTALVHEAFLKLTCGNAIQFKDKNHFYQVAVIAMRRILVDHARGRDRAKRDGKMKRQLLGDCETAAESDPEQILSIDEAISRLEQQDADAAAVVRMRFFVGLSLEETARALNKSISGVRRDWIYARACLFRELCDGRRESVGVARA